MAQQVSEAARRRMTRDLIECLRHASIETPPWHLSPSERWHLLRDTLLGHPPIRGGVRPRDMPLDDNCVRTQALARAIQRLRPYKSEHGRILFSRWLTFYCLLCLDIGGTDLRRLQDCVVELRRAIGLIGDGNDCPFVHGLLGVLGLSRQEWKRGLDDRKSDTEHATLARWAALATAAASGKVPARADRPAREQWRKRLVTRMSGLDRRARESRRVLDEGQRQLARLDDIERRLVTIKTVHVQSYIARAVGHWPMRGASAWCAQSLALARDMMLARHKNALLFTDSDTLVSLWTGADESPTLMSRQLQRDWRAFWKSPTTSPLTARRRFPRLADFIAQVGDAAAKIGPEVSVKAHQVLSLLDMCVPQPANDPPKKAAVLPAPPPVAGRNACAHVRDDRAIFDQCPDWHDKNRPADKIGFTSIVWSLCGTTFRTHAFEGLRTALVRPNFQMAPVKQQDWLNALDMQNEPLVHLKLDGDGVGEIFRGSRYADFPRLGLELAYAMRTRLVAAVSQAMAEHARLRPSKPFTVLPIDLVYLGGDDLYCCLPATLVDAFLDGFGDESAITGPWSKTRYTFVAFQFPPRPAYKAGNPSHDVESQRKRRANLAATEAMNRALKTVKEAGKAVARGERPPSPAHLAADLHDFVAPHAIDLTCREVDARHGCVHGAYFELNLAELISATGP